MNEMNLTYEYIFLPVYKLRTILSRSLSLYSAALQEIYYENVGTVEPLL